MIITNGCSFQDTFAASFGTFTSCFQSSLVSILHYCLIAQGLLLEFLLLLVVEFKDIGGRMTGLVIYQPCCHYYS